MLKRLLQLSILFILGLSLLSSQVFAQSWLDKKRLPSVMLQNIEGELLNVAQKYGNNGKVTIFKFWSVWTLDCERDLETTAQLARNWKGELDIEIVSVSLYDQKNAEDVRDYMQKKGWNFDVLIDPDDAFLKIMKAKGDILPYTVAIDHKGFVVHEGKSNGDFLEQLKMKDVILEARSRLPKVTPAEQRMTNNMKKTALSTPSRRVPITKTAYTPKSSKSWLSEVYQQPERIIPKVTIEDLRKKGQTQQTALNTIKSTLPKPKPVINVEDVPNLTTTTEMQKPEPIVTTPKVKNVDEPKQKTQLVLPTPKVKNADEPKQKTQLVLPTPKVKNADEPKQKTQLVIDKKTVPEKLMLTSNTIPAVPTKEKALSTLTNRVPAPPSKPAPKKINWEKHFTPPPATTAPEKAKPKEQPKATVKRPLKPKRTNTNVTPKKPKTKLKEKPKATVKRPIKPKTMPVRKAPVKKAALKPAAQPKKTKRIRNSLPPILSKPPTIKYDNDNPVSLDGRKVKKGKKTHVTSNQILLKVWDTQYEDGDVLSLSLNGQWILKNHPLKKKEQEINITINKDDNNYLILYAHNEGSRPPNTAAVTIFDGKKDRTFNLSSNMSSCDAINLIFTEPDKKSK